jgi:hypothetical protein
MLQRLIDQSIVRRHALDIDPPFMRVDIKNMVERAHIELPLA